MENTTVTINVETTEIPFQAIDMVARLVYWYQDKIQTWVEEKEEIIDTWVIAIDPETMKPFVDEDGNETWETNKEKRFFTIPVIEKNPESVEIFLERKYKESINSMIQRDYTEAVKRQTENQVKDMNFIKM